MKKISEADIKEILNTGVSEIIDREHLERALLSGKKLKIKFGIDPTAPDLHLGHSVPLRKLARLQKAGHEIILIIGDFTAQIGDPSGKDTARQPLTAKEVKGNLKKYLSQAGKIIDVKKAKVFHNSKWLAKNAETIISLAATGSIQQVLHREDFKNRIAQGRDVTLLEIMYPIFQGYDSVMVHADVEVGGTDQKLNLLAGRRMQRHFKQSEQDILTTPLLVGTDGVIKMSKSAGNYIALEEKPGPMFAKVMAVPDGEMKNYFELLTDVPADEIRNFTGKPMEMKKRLASEIVKIYHGAKAAEKAKEDFEQTFSKKEIPADIAVYKTEQGKEWTAFLIEVKAANSKSEAKRLISGGAIEFEGVKINNSSEKIEKSGSAKIGKHKFIRIEVK